MRIRKLIWILAGCCLLSGCRSGNANLSEKNVSDTEVTEESAESRKETEQDFPQRIQEDVGENVHIDAECVYPENFPEGKGLKAVQSGSTLWEQREQIVDKFAKGNPVLDVEETSYDDFQSESYTLTETTGISITSENVLNYFSDQATYILNTIMEDDRFDTYNGNEFQTTTDLAFISQEEAWNQIKSFLQEIGVEVTDAYTCYVMDYKTMQQEEEKIYQLLQEEDTKTFEKKEQWSADDDSYYFKTSIAWNGYPVIPYMSGEGNDEQNVSVVYDKSGIISMMIIGHYPMQEKEEVDIESPVKVAELLAEPLNNIISDTTYEIQKLTLCQVVIGKNHETGMAEIVPCWKCSVQVKNNQEDPGYTTYYYYNAETLESIS